jgi:hypothetical protein
MNLTQLDREIAELRAEAITLAILGDSVGAQFAHNRAAELQQLRAEAMRAELPIHSDK